MAEAVGASGEVRFVISADDDACVVRIIGVVDASTAPTVEETLTDLIQSDSTHLVLDLSEMEFIDSTGLGVLVIALKRVAERDGSLLLRSPRSGARKVLSITRLDQVFPISD